VTTSGVTDWPLTAGDVVTQAMVELGALSQGEEPSGDEMEDGLLRLNAMLRSWAGEGNLFREQTVELTFGAGIGSLALDAGIRAVSSAWFKGSYNRILAEWNRSQYLSLPTPGQSGSPVAWYAEQGISGVTFHLWPVPTVSSVIVVDCSRHAQTVTDPAETVDVPEEWQEALIMSLASRLAAMFGTADTAPAKVSRIDQRAQALYQRLLDRDRPDAYVFEPDY
jgi:hypothetical protein